MDNYNAIELSDEQLEAVTGGDIVNLGSSLSANNFLNQINIAAAPTVNVSLFNLGNLSQSGSIIGQGNNSTQGAQH